MLIVDDDPATRELLRARFELVPDLVVVGEAADGDEAIERAAELRPELVTLDLIMPGRGGAACIPELRAAAPGVRILVFSSDIKEADLREASRPDAALQKGASLDILISLLTGLAAQGGRVA